MSEVAPNEGREWVEEENGRIVQERQGSSVEEMRGGSGLAEFAEDEEGSGVITEDVQWEPGVAAVVKGQGNDYSMEVEYGMDELRILTTSDVVSEKSEISLDATSSVPRSSLVVSALALLPSSRSSPLASTLISFFSDTTSLVARLLSSSMPFSISTE